MSKTVEDVANEFIDAVAERAERFGLARTLGLLKGLLIVAEGPLSLDEMASRLGVSKGSVSTNIRYLERWKMARRVFNRNDRRNYYELRGTIWDIETEVISTILKEEIEVFKGLLERWKGELAEASDEDAERRELLLERFGDMEEYVDAIEHLLRVLLKSGKVTSAAIKTIDIT